MSEKTIPFAPWAVPKTKHLGGGVYVTDVYGWHVLNSLVYLAWRKLRGEASS